jgi:hypothetical protein
LTRKPHQADADSKPDREKSQHKFNFFYIGDITILNSQRSLGARAVPPFDCLGHRARCATPKPHYVPKQSVRFRHSTAIFDNRSIAANRST